MTDKSKASGSTSKAQRPRLHPQQCVDVVNLALTVENPVETLNCI